MEASKPKLSIEVKHLLLDCWEKKFYVNVVYILQALHVTKRLVQNFKDSKVELA